MSAAAQSQAAQKSLPKVLRIGVVQEGKIIQERLIKSGETVTVGDSPKAMFSYPGLGIGGSHALFVASGSSYALVVPEKVEGKISWKDGIRDLSELRSRGDMQKRGEHWALPLGENVRGKVALGSVTLLFQFVNAPPEPVRAVTAADFKPRMFNDDDPLFLGLLGVFNLIAVLFYVAILVHPPVEDNALDHIDRALDLVVDKVEQIQIEETKPLIEDKGTEDKKVEDKKPAAKSEDAAPSAKPAPTADSVARKSLLLQMLGTTGEGSDQIASDILGDQAAMSGKLDSALSGVNGTEMASADSVGLMKGSGAGGTGDAAVGITQSSAGKAGTGDAATIAIKKPKVDVGEGDVDAEEGDPADIGRVVRGSKGRIETCVQAALKKDPNTNGRVGIGWTIQAGKVTEAHVVKNTTDNAELGACMMKTVRALRFDASVTATVDEWAWVVSGQ